MPGGPHAPRIMFFSFCIKRSLFADSLVFSVVSWCIDSHRTTGHESWAPLVSPPILCRLSCPASLSVKWLSALHTQTRSFHLWAYLKSHVISGWPAALAVCRPEHTGRLAWGALCSGLLLFWPVLSSCSHLGLWQYAVWKERRLAAWETWVWVPFWLAHLLTLVLGGSSDLSESSFCHLQNENKTWKGCCEVGIMYLKASSLESGIW